ncbi:MAG: outer membrane lipid asymmetry maintenance protein MlaD [Rickettsiales bacterium]|nr:outer membrane lipid asymmetry maintenance protein MlaD [Rickettsiales bacterium]
MNSRSIIESLIGALVIAVAASFVFIAYKSGTVSSSTGYNISAKFNNIGGLNVGSDVRVSGIKIGTVIDQTIDQSDGLYLADVTLNISNDIKLPTDTTAAIISDGLLGSKYVALEPGGSEDFIQEGDRIKLTQSSVSIESLIGKFVFGGPDDEQSDAGSSNSLGL